MSGNKGDNMSQLPEPDANDVRPPQPPDDSPTVCHKCGEPLFDNGTVYVHRYTVGNITFNTQDCKRS